MHRNGRLYHPGPRPEDGRAAVDVASSTSSADIQEVQYIRLIQAGRGPRALAGPQEQDDWPSGTTNIQRGADIAVHAPLHPEEEPSKTSHSINHGPWR